jgi:hypothetical protein
MQKKRNLMIFKIIIDHNECIIDNNEEIKIK